jgi:threonine dehydratase
MQNERRGFPTIDDINRARDLISDSVKKTPLQRSETFSKLTGTNVSLKLESLQKTGSFKVRGALVKLGMLSKEEEKAGVIAASAGNHAQGVAYAALKKNIPCTIVMPKNASPAKVAATKSYGATVILRGITYEESWLAAEEIAKERGHAIIHAFDDPDIISGQGTIGLELLEDLPEVDEVYLPIGGGGLAAGVAIAIKTKNPAVKIIGIESTAFPSMKESLSYGSILNIVAGHTIADGISVKSPGKLTYEIASQYIDDLQLVDDSSIVETMFLLMERAKLVVEPAGAASLAYLIEKGHPNKNKNVIALLSGGNVDMYLLGQVVAKGLMNMGRMLKIFIQLPDRPGALKTIVDIIAELSVNIVEVVHDRLSSNVSAGTAGVYLSLEMENSTYAERLLDHLDSKGVKFKIVN